MSSEPVVLEEDLDLDLDPTPAEEPTGDPTGYYFARFGTFLLTAEDTSTPIPEVYKAVLKALAKDSRVQAVRSKPLRPHWSYYKEVFPLGPDLDEEDILSGQDSLPAVQFSDPIIIELRVPIKNQPLFQGENDVPTDHYWIAWDGLTAVVLWETDADTTYPPRSAGHIVKDVLSTATEAAGFGLMQQACSPACKNMFAHSSIRVLQFPGDSGLIDAFQSTGRSLAVARVESKHDPVAVLISIAGRILSTGENFALFKNYSRRLMKVEDLAHDFVDELLIHDYAEIEHRRKKLLSRMGARLKSFGKRGRHRPDELIASLWLLMASKETLLRICNERRRSFSRMADRAGTETLYATDRRDDEHSIDSLDFTFIRSAVEQKSNRIDNRVIAWATGCGALAAVLGAVIGRLWA